VNSIAEESGLVVGQEVIAVDGQATSTVSDVRFALLKRLGDTGNIDLTIGNALSDVGQRYALPIVNWLGEAEAPDPAAALGLSLGFLPIRPEVGSLSEGGAAARAGFQVGDVIIDAAGVPMAQWTDWVEFVRARPNQRFDVLVDRAGSQVTLSVMPQNRNAIGTVGMGVALPEIPDSRIRRQSRGPIEALGAAVNRTYELTIFTFESMWKMVQGLISTKNLSGPIAIAQIAASTAESGFTTWLSFLALLSISLGAINLLPIPVLDGGHIVFHVVEGLMGRPVPEQIQIMSFQLGLAAVFTLMMFAIYNDVARL
jgi:regulator of sigma E protease